MHWSEASITWGREDHPTLMPRPEGYALVLNPIMFSETHICQFSHVLIDGGSSINLLYRTSMEKLGSYQANLPWNHAKTFLHANGENPVGGAVWGER
jgi:hypothetical protein